MDAANWHLAAIEGEDASRFLQGHLTSDMETLMPQRAQLSAACDNRGRVLASLYILKQEDTNFYIFSPVEVWHHLIEFWRPYFALYRRTHLRDLTGVCCLKIKKALEQTEPLLSLSFDAELELLLLPPAMKRRLSDCFAWNSWLIDKEIPHIYADIRGKWIPQMLGYDRLGAVSFTKGCYLGQEVVARVHYRGKPNRVCRQLNFSLESSPYINMPLYNAKRDIVGNLMNFYAAAPHSYKGLAVVSINVVDIRHLFIQENGKFRELDEGR